MNNSDQTDLNIWSQRLITLTLVLLGVSFLGILILGSYYNQQITQALSFQAEDNFRCDTAYGVHCFGDFQEIRYALPTEGYPNVWVNSNNAYPPSALMPHVIAKVIQNLFGVQVALRTYLSFLTFCLVVPALYAAKNVKAKYQQVLLFLILSAFAQPVIANLDRGNSAGLAIPFLMIFAIKFFKGSNFGAAIAIIGAAAIRPQYILLAIAFLAIRRFKYFSFSILGVGFAILLPFLFWPGDTISNFESWYQNLSGFSKQYNSTVLADLSLSSVFRKSLETQSYLAVSVAVLILITITFMLLQTKNNRGRILIATLCLPCLLPEVSFAYYATFVLVIAAMIIAHKNFLIDEQDLIVASKNKAFQAKEFYNYFLITVIAISLSPLPFVFQVGRNSISLENFSILWLIVIILTLILQILEFRKVKILK